MPYDPDWDLEEKGAAATTRSTSADYMHSPYGNYPHDAQAENRPQRGVVHDNAGGLKGAEKMAVDTPAPRWTSPHPEQQASTTATGRLPFPGAAAVARLSQVEVVLHSSPRRDAFMVPADRPTSSYGDDANLVTSDLVPQPRPRPRHVEAPKAEAPVPPANKSQPGVSLGTSPAITPQQPKKRGRPFGWRLGSGPYSAMRAGGTPGSTTPRPKPKKPAGEARPRGRPGRKPAPTARQLYLKLNPHFVTFRCEWEKCPAELQNLETLRKHLLKVHGHPSSPAASNSAPSAEASSTSTSTSPSAPPAPTLPCRWASCTSPRFYSRDAFASHVEEAHLTPFLWHVGDGPRNSTPSPDFSLVGPAHGDKRRSNDHLQQQQRQQQQQPPQHAPSSTGTGTGPTNNSNDSSSSSSSKINDAAPLPPYLFDARGNQVTPSVRDQQLENEEDRRRRAARVGRVLWLRDRHAPPEPEHTPRELEMIARVVSEKRARQRMLREYAARVCGGGGRGKGEGGDLEGWRGLLA